ncbi:MAG: sulfatase-like hydrolase/transferase, partial [Saprospiraceae bacterium]|nr:sulfatase-like hydrolase/transferase [Saprospiraceae bacterium]
MKHLNHHSERDLIYNRKVDPSFESISTPLRFFYISIICGLMMVSCLSVTSNPAENNNSRSPNIILIIGDDHGYPYFGFMGADYVQTPNMDTLASSGFVFTNAYVPSNHCRPSLQALITGTLPIVHNNMVDSMAQAKMALMRFDSEESRNSWEKNFRHQAMESFETLPKILTTKGYHSFQGGKWWEYHYKNGGFTDGMTTGWTEEERKEGGTWFKRFMGGDGLALARATMQPVYDFIDSTSDTPFFIWYAPELPHYPFNAPDKYYNIYKEEDMAESAKRYYANCSWFDDGVGALINYLKEKDLYNNTVFIYVNDNGWEQEPHQEFRHDSLRWHNGGDKGKLGINDQSFRTPIVIAQKNAIQSGRDDESLIHSIDIFSTILELAGISADDYEKSQSLLPLITGSEV